MREIEFRGISKTTKKMIYGYLVRCHGKNKEYYAIKDTNSNINNGKVNLIPTEIFLKTIGQYTGLKDKNGKKIFEGDFLRIPAKDKWEETNFSFFEVFFHDNDCADRHIGFQMGRMHNCGAIAGGFSGWQFLPKTTKKFEIIGNIHENKNLLEEI